jgi:hypothetical protein
LFSWRLRGTAPSGAFASLTLTRPSNALFEIGRGGALVKTVDDLRAGGA